MRKNKEFILLKKYLSKLLFTFFAILVANNVVLSQVNTPKDSIPTQPADTIHSETISIANDSIIPSPDSLHVDTLAIPEIGRNKRGKSKDFDVPVYYNSDDSLLNDMKNRKAFLYGNAVVK